jgi:chorismate synthase
MTMGDEIQRRYPRLIRCMRSAAVLTEAEAIGALVEYKVFGIREGFGSEAVAHLGGQLAAIRHGIQYRHFTSSTL